MLPFAAGPTSSLLIYMSGVLSMLPLGAAAIAEMDHSCPLTSNCKPSTGSTARPASGPKRVARTDYAGMALRRADPPFLVQTLLAQHHHPAGDRDLSRLLEKSFRGERVGPLRVSGPFEVRHLERDRFGHGGVPHGSRCYGPRVGIGKTNGLSPNLHTHQDGPQPTGFSRGWVCVETVRTGPLP